jgi:hypothetical protein
MLVSLSPAVGVTALASPVNVGEAIGAFSVSSSRIAACTSVAEILPPGAKVMLEAAPPPLPPPPLI